MFLLEGRPRLVIWAVGETVGEAERRVNNRLAHSPNYDDLVAGTEHVDCSIEFKTDALFGDEVMDALDHFHDGGGKAKVFKDGQELPVTFDFWHADMVVSHFLRPVALGFLQVVDSAALSTVLTTAYQLQSNGNRSLPAVFDEESKTYLLAGSWSQKETAAGNPAEPDAMSAILSIPEDTVAPAIHDGRLAVYSSTSLSPSSLPLVTSLLYSRSISIQRSPLRQGHIVYSPDFLAGLGPALAIAESPPLPPFPSSSALPLHLLNAPCQP
ncbi:unnamed protein product [Cutaneotrichosporon oleaginosum]